MKLKHYWLVSTGLTSPAMSIDISKLFKHEAKIYTEEEILSRDFHSTVFQPFNFFEDTEQTRQTKRDVYFNSGFYPSDALLRFGGRLCFTGSLDQEQWPSLASLARC